MAQVMTHEEFEAWCAEIDLADIQGIRHILRALGDGKTYAYALGLPGLQLHELHRDYDRLLITAKKRRDELDRDQYLEVKWKITY